MPDAIPEEEKSRRLALLQDHQRQIQIVRNEKSGRRIEFEVLVDTHHSARNQWAGRTTSNRIVNFTSSRENLLGQYRSGAQGHASGPNSLIGEHVL